MVKFSRERRILAWTFLFGLLAHGYCYFNLSYSHDSLMVYQDDEYMQIAVGRFMHLPYLRLRGGFYTPALVGALSLLFLGLAICLMVRLLDMRRRSLLCLTTGILTTCATVTLTNATYIQDVDMYMLSLLLAAAGGWICARSRWGFWTAGIFFCLSMGFYQAFFQAAVFLAMMYVVKLILDGVPPQAVLRAGLHQVGGLLLGLLFYSAALQLVFAVTGIPLLSTYGLGSAARYESLGELLAYIRHTYGYVLHYFLHPAIHLSALAAAADLFLLVLSLLLVGFLVWRQQIRGWSLALLALVLCLMPFGMNVVYFISHGEEHYLMIFSLFLAYLFAAFLTERFLREAAPAVLHRWVRRAVCCALGIVLFGSVVYAGQVYLKKDLEYQTTVFTLTRVADRLEQLEGYQPGETPVALLGTLEDSPLLLRRPGQEALFSDTGLWNELSVTYYETYAAFFHRVLGYSIHILSQEQSDAWRERAEDLPVFPAPGSCAMLDGTAVVKLS